MTAFGEHMIYAALGAAAVGMELGLSDSEISRGVSAYETVGSRAKVTEVRGLTVIDDCYNANPNSVMSALSSMAGLEGRKIAVLGDMLELGEASARLHMAVGAAAAETCDMVFACGKEARNIAEGTRAAGGKAFWFENKKELTDKLESWLLPGDILLIKASHGMHFEEIVEAICGEGKKNI
jgi:UDP-N-acetylmuramoyl-tripeptide--D-alanyl-D-alanine ligase